MSYLDPPPMPAPVVVHKDVGGFVADYEARTAIYRVTGQEVRLHECRSACTLALSLPNVCVYPDSVLKFHQAYDPRNRQVDETVSQQLFNSYPAAVRARLGGLTRGYRILRGSELISLGVRNCDDRRTMVATTAVPRKPAAAHPRAEAQPGERASIFDGLVQSVMAALGQSASSSGTLGTAPPLAVAAKTTIGAGTEGLVPLPPARPQEFASRLDPSAPRDSTPAIPDVAADRGPAARGVSAPDRVGRAVLESSRAAPVMSGAQPILPARFAAFTPLR